MIPGISDEMIFNESKHFDTNQGNLLELEPSLLSSGKVGSSRVAEIAPGELQDWVRSKCPVYGSSASPSQNASAHFRCLCVILFFLNAIPRGDHCFFGDSHAETLTNLRISTPGSHGRAPGIFHAPITEIWSGNRRLDTPLRLGHGQLCQAIAVLDKAGGFYHDDYGIYFSTLSNRDAKQNARIASAAKRDSSSMKSLAVLSIIFVPPSCIATIASMPMLSW
ncbi:uncharacterized protein IWZ02DRAFT_275412 [Phyllosticta citriasiana]|uniref:uncharacterized protein n=1 Tax=Phyllosticta citriasiana TaxID=595635 RepID=UPI0030FDB1E8